MVSSVFRRWHDCSGCAYLTNPLTLITVLSTEIFYYVERKGMEMNIQIKDALDQTSFMLMALQEIRNDGRELKKKQEATDEDDGADLLGPLLGPSIKDDGGPAPTIPNGFEIPQNLEFVGPELNLLVGFRRLRWALLSSESTFVSDAVWKAASNYDKYVAGFVERCIFRLVICSSYLSTFLGS
jgi:hypothetical protein